MKYKNYSYKECVNKGKNLLEQHKMVKYDMCLLTLRVCDIKIGGDRTSGNIYSIKKFAEDIGMNYGTLKNWVKEHKNVVEKLPRKPKAEDYRVIRQVMRKVNNKTPKKDVVKYFDHYSKYTDEDHALLNQIKHAKSIKNFAEDYVLSMFNQEDIDQLETLMEEALVNIRISRKSRIKIKKSKKRVVSSKAK